MPKKKPDDPQKAALYDLLLKRFGQVDFNRKFDWLLAPSNCLTPSDYPVDYRKIVKALCKHRGRTGFCNVRPQYAKMECDFVVEDRKLIVEYDERQHFTAPRRIALQNYPPDVVLSYSAADWMKYCDEIDAHDNDPLYRDERRALYDSVRDIEAFRHGWTLLRIKDGDIDWETANIETLDKVLNHGISQRGAKTMTMTKSLAGSGKEGRDGDQRRPDLKICKLGIVARNYKTTSSFKKFLPEVLQRLDKEGCDAVLFSLFSLPLGYDPRETFRGLKNIKTVFVEECRKKRGAEKPIGKGFVVYHRPRSGWKDYRLKQQIKSTNAEKKKDIHEFIENEMPRRYLGNCGVLLCGESTIVKKVKENFDIYGFRSIIPKEVRIILNPCHDYMKRQHVMKEKRKFLSKGKRWVISVWCKGKKGEERGVPWTIHYNGKEWDRDKVKIDFDADDLYVGVLDIR